jgi:hypothetical protein
MRPFVSLKNEDGTPFRNVGGKLPNHTAQQSRRSGCSAVKRRKPQSDVRLFSVKSVFISDYFIFLIYCVF